MPYIKQADRPAIDTGNKIPTVAGELNYQLTTLIKNHLNDVGRNYANYNAIIGAIDIVKERAVKEFSVKIMHSLKDTIEDEMTRMAFLYLKNTKGDGSLKNIRGCLRCVELELYRRAIVPYENKKIEENGDVY